MNKIADFILDMKNILSLVVAFVFVYCTVQGIFDSKDIFTIVLMTFSFFLGSKVNKLVEQKKS